MQPVICLHWRNQEIDKYKFFWYTICCSTEHWRILNSWNKYNRMQNFGKIPKWRTAWSGLIRLPLRPMQQTYELVFCINYYLHAHWQYSKFPGYFLLLLNTELRGFFSEAVGWSCEMLGLWFFFSNRKQVRSNVFVVANDMFVKFDRVGFVFNIYVKKNHKKKSILRVLS